jgi:hypothetical protein
MSKAHLHLLDLSTQTWVPATGSAIGAMGGGAGATAASSVDSWSYAAASGGITDTSDVSLAAAPGVGLVNYLTDLQLANSDATVGTEVVIKSGSTVLWRTFLPAGRPASLTGTMPVSFTFSRPLRADSNTALTVAAITTSAELYVNAQGFIGQSEDQVEAAASNVVEIFDIAGNQLTDNGGNYLVQGYP